jgi:Ca2+:H+ antiporter
METPTTRLRKSAKTEHDSMPVSQNQYLPLADGNKPPLANETPAPQASRPSNERTPTITRPLDVAKSGFATLKMVLGESYTSYLLPFVFLGIIAGKQHWDDSLVFLLNFLAILPLASLLSFATEELAKSVGQLLGGLINATFGNAVEMIVRQRITACSFSQSTSDLAIFRLESLLSVAAK